MNHLRFQVNVGTLSVSWSQDGLLKRIEWNPRASGAESWTTISRVRLPANLAELVDRFRGYFAYGEPVGPIPWERIDASDWSPFQREVYRAIEAIPHGETRTYSWVAMRLRRMGACRAVGQALRRNPLPVLVPCHRVVAVNTIGGFMGEDDPSRPELGLKQRLIDLERSYLNPPFPFVSALYGT